MKHNYKEVKNDFIKRGYIPLFTEYKNCDTKLKFMNKEGYKGIITQSHLKDIDNYSYFSKRNPFVIYNINLYCEENKLLCRVYNQEYKGIDDFLKVKCLVCGKDFYTTWHTISSKRHMKYKKCCKECSNKMTHNNLKNKKSLKEVKENFKKHNLLLLEDEYKNNKTKMHCVNKDGYQGMISFHQLNGGSFFYKFDKTNPYTIDNVNNFLKLSGTKTRMISLYYNQCRDIYEFKCECGNIFKRRLDSVIYNQAFYCPDCSKWRKSQYHYKVRDYLNKNSIKFEEEKVFQDCRDKNPLPFDFYLPDYNICIEVQGQQHYCRSGFNNDIVEFEKIVFHDLKKKYFCECRNIKLIKIDYFNFKNEDYVYILNSLLGITT